MRQKVTATDYSAMGGQSQSQSNTNAGYSNGMSQGKSNGYYSASQSGNSSGSANQQYGQLWNQGNSTNQNGGAMNTFVGNSLQDQGIKMSSGGNSSIKPNGWYDMWTYENQGSGYFLPNSQFSNGTDDFGTLGETTTYTLENGKWVISHEGDTWVNQLESAGGKHMVGDAI